MSPRARTWAPVFFVLAAAACATANNPSDESDGTSFPSNTGGSSTGTSSGGSTPSMTGGASASGGMGGGASGGSASGGAGSPFEGNCSELPYYDEVDATDGLGVLLCEKSRDGCSGVALDEYHVFRCISNHVPNCKQHQGMTAGSWEYVAPCATWGMGGGAGDSGI